MTNVSQKSIDTLHKMLSRSSMNTYPDNLQRKGAPLTEEQKRVFFPDEDTKAKFSTIESLATPEATDMANSLSEGNHKPGNAFSKHDYDTIIRFISEHKRFVSQNSHYQKDLLIIENSVKAARSEASPRGLISTIRLYELLEAAHYRSYRVEMNRGNRYHSLIEVEHAKEWVKFHKDISSIQELSVDFRRGDLLEKLQLAGVSIQDIKIILDRIIHSKETTDIDAHKLVAYIIENQPHELQNFKEYGNQNRNLALAQVDEEEEIIKEHRMIATPVSFILTFIVLAIMLGGLSLASSISSVSDGIEIIDTIVDFAEGWHLVVLAVLSFAGFFGFSELSLHKKKKQVDAIGAQKYYSESESHRRRRFKKIKQETQSKAIASKTLAGKRGYDIALMSYKGNNLSLSSGSLAYDAITSGGFLKGAFNRVYCENSANFHNVLAHTVSNAVQDDRKALLITKDEEQQYLAKYDTNPNTETITLSSTDSEIQNIQNRLAEGNLGVIILDKMDVIDAIKIEKALYDKYELIQEHSIPVIILQDLIESDEDFSQAMLNDIADQVVEVYAGSLDDKEAKNKMFINVIENKLTALTEELSTVQFDKNTTKITEVLELGTEKGFLDKYDANTWIDVQTGYQIDGDTVEEAEAVFTLNKELYHTISNKVCRLILDSTSEAIEARDNRMIAHYEPKSKPKTIKPTANHNTQSRGLPQLPKSAPEEIEPLINFSTIKEQYDEIVDTVMSYQMDISKAIRFPAFNDPAVPAVQEMQIQLRKTKRLIEQYDTTQQGDLDDIVDNVDILQVRVDAAEKTAEKIAWSDVTLEERNDMELAQNLIKQISSPGNPDDMRRNLYIKLKDVVTRLNKRHEIVPTELVLEIEKNSALALPSAG